jgi:hypothetical protein
VPHDLPAQHDRFALVHDRELSDLIDGLQWAFDELNRGTDAWPGHPIELYPTVTQMGAKTVPCIRIRRPQGTLPLAARPRATPAPMPAETPPVEAYADADFGDDLPEAFR